MWGGAALLKEEFVTFFQSRESKVKFCQKALRRKLDHSFHRVLLERGGWGKETIRSARSAQFQELLSCSCALSLSVPGPRSDCRAGEALAGTWPLDKGALGSMGSGSVERLVV